MIILNISAVVLISLGVALILKLTPERIGDDLMRFMRKEQSLSRKVAIAQGRAKKRKLQTAILDVYNALVSTGAENKFAVLCSVSIIGFTAGCLFAAIIGNVILFVVFAVICIAIPYGYAKSLVSSYNKQISDELETALSIITTAYISNEDIIYAIENSIDYINPPVQHVFKEFLGKTKLISSNVKLAIVQMKSRINNEVFREWCDNLIECQDNITLKRTLQPITARLSDIRIVNAELDTLIMNPRREFFMMLFMTITNIPMLYFVNREWGLILFQTFIGQIVLGIIAIICITTTILCFKYTQPLEYKR
jgi:Flp pilus assembly protein TadB